MPQLPPTTVTMTAIERWREAMEAYRHAWIRSVVPIWPWLTPPGAIGTHAAGDRPSPAFRHHAPGRTIAELSVGDSASVTRTITQGDIDTFARISGDDNPAHVDAGWAADSPFKGRVAHGMLTAGSISAVLGTLLPGPGAIYMSQTLRWLAPVRPGDTVTATVTVAEIIAEKGRVVLETVVERDGETVLTGQALVMPPRA